MTIDPAELVVALKTTGAAHCPVHGCAVQIVETRKHGAGEDATTVAGYVKGMVIKSMTDHVGMAHDKP